MHNEESADPSTSQVAASACACTVCGCVCDDLRISVAAGRIRQAAGACALAEPWLLNQDSCAPALAQVDGSAVPLESAIDRAAQILRGARAPLIFGLSGVGTEGQRAAVALADKIGANIDTPASSLPLTLAMQEVGLSTCSLGEVRHRADLILFWGADPVVHQPRLLERVVLAPALDPLQQDRIVRDRSRRTVVAIDVRRTATAEWADRFVPVEEGRQFETIWALRGLVRDPPLTGIAATGMAPADLAELGELVKGCRFGVVFFGRGLSREGPRTVEALVRLVMDLNGRTRRFYAQGLLGEGAGGAENVLAWQTGYPAGVNLAHGYPRCNPGEFSAQNLLERGEVDVCLLVGSDAAAHLSGPAGAVLARLPTIVLDPPGAQPAHPANVRITTAVPGIHAPGTVYRMDGVPIPLRAVLPESYPRVGTVLQAVSDRLDTDAAAPASR